MRSMVCVVFFSLCSWSVAASFFFSPPFVVFSHAVLT